MTFDPTTNRIQTVHLTPEERAALEAWPHGWEANVGGWYTTSLPCDTWSPHFVYRGKPAPVVTSVWFNRHNDGMSGPFTTRKSADHCAYSNRVDVLRIDTCNGVSTAHLEGLE